MKRIVSVLLLFVLLLSASGCGKKNVVDGFELMLCPQDVEKLAELKLDDAFISYDIDPYREKEYFEHPLNEKSLSVEILGTEAKFDMGKVYSFKCEESRYISGSYYASYGNRGMNENVTINLDTRKVICAYVPSMNLPPVVEGGINSEEELLLAADTFMEMQGVDTTDCKVTYYRVSVPLPYMRHKVMSNLVNDVEDENRNVFYPGYNSYEVYYHKYVGEAPTETIYYVGLRSNGSVFSFSTQASGDYEGITADSFDIGAFNVVIDNFLDKISNGANKLYTKKAKVFVYISQDIYGRPMLVAQVSEFCYYKTFYHRLRRKEESVGKFYICSLIDTE